MYFTVVLAAVGIGFLVYAFFLCGPEKGWAQTEETYPDLEKGFGPAEIVASSSAGGHRHRHVAYVARHSYSRLGQQDYDVSLSPTEERASWVFLDD